MMKEWECNQDNHFHSEIIANRVFNPLLDYLQPVVATVLIRVQTGKTASNPSVWIQDPEQYDYRQSSRTSTHLVYKYYLLAEARH